MIGNIPIVYSPENTPLGWNPQQTVKLAIDCETGELVSAESLLSLDEVIFTAMRRTAMAARIARKRGIDAVRFQCAICKHPLFLSRHRGAVTNRWFVHDGKSEQCPWYEGSRVSPDQTKALIYRGQQEGAQHQEYKRFLVHWLTQDPLVSAIALEQTTFSETLKGEWRRPDVKCNYRGKPLVFEIQLSYTFLSDVIARDQFYKREGIFIIWVFARFDLNRAVVTDEAFFNRRNLFVLDAEAINQTNESGVLTFSGYRQSPRLIDERLNETWMSDFVRLSDVLFPLETFRPYFFDYEAACEALEAERIGAARVKEEEVWRQGINEYLDLALHYYDSDHADDARAEVLSKVDELEESGVWHRGFEALREWGFYGMRGVLPALLSIKRNRPVSYSSKLTVFQVMEAGLRTGHGGVGQHAYAILYLWAYRSFKPQMTEKNRLWLSNYAHRIKKSVDAGETTYRRHCGYDEAISMLFPELESQLVTTFGCL